MLFPNIGTCGFLQNFRPIFSYFSIILDKIKLADGYFIRLHSADMDKCVAYGFSEALAALNSSQVMYFVN